MSEVELAKILCVDDEPNVLAGLKRQLRNKFDVHTAESGAEGLKLLRENGPFPVVVSDMRMPQMNGAEFLSKVRQHFPHTVRILLTGQSDMESAVSAVNEGQIFRFLTKPCPPEFFLEVLTTAVEQNRLATVEKELLEKTLFGSVKVLTDVLSLVNPAAFSRSSRIRHYVRHGMNKLDVKNKWQFELAAMLSQLGCVTMPADILAKVYADQALSPQERESYAGHPAVAHDLIIKIPRLKAVASMIKNQADNVGAHENTPLEKLDAVVLGAQLLKLSEILDASEVRGKSIQTTLNELKSKASIYHPALVALYADVKAADDTAGIRKMVTVGELTLNMTTDENIVTTNDALVVPKGQEVTEAMLARLKVMAANNVIKQPFRVIVR
ncbi:MAG: response regulator [Gammaproteobacteria bacterium]|nr:response regulator [Gammaproteobacteria bacterium]